jgi:hypothetical protein
MKRKHDFNKSSDTPCRCYICGSNNKLFPDFQTKDIYLEERKVKEGFKLCSTSPTIWIAQPKVYASMGINTTVCLKYYLHNITHYIITQKENSTNNWPIRNCLSPRINPTICQDSSSMEKGCTRYLHTLFKRVQTLLGLKSRKSSMPWRPVPSMTIPRDSSLLSKPRHGLTKIACWTGLTGWGTPIPRAPIMSGETRTLQWTSYLSIWCDMCAT